MNTSNATCRLCNSKGMDILYSSTRHPITVARCYECHQVSVINPPDFAVQKSFYDDEKYYEIFAELISNKEIFDRYKTSLDEISKAINNLDIDQTTKPRLLDIGAGVGNFLNLARQNNFDIYGTEISKPAIQMAKEVNNIHLQQILIESDDRNEFFDVITMWGLLEHVIDPNNLINNAYRLLKKNGLLLIYTPRWCLYDSISIIFAKLLRLTIFIDRRLNLSHLQIYQDTELIKRLVISNFQIYKIERLCEYNLPLKEYLLSLEFPKTIIESSSKFIKSLIKNKLFFRNNIKIICRKISP